MPTIQTKEPYVVPAIAEKKFDGVSPVEITTGVIDTNGAEIFYAKIRSVYTNDKERSNIHLPEVVVDNMTQFIVDKLDANEQIEFMKDMEAYIALQLKLAKVILTKREII